MPSPGVTFIRALGCNLPYVPAKKLTRPGVWAQCDAIGFHGCAVGLRGTRRAEGCRDIRVASRKGRPEAGRGSKKGRIQMIPRLESLGHWTHEMSAQKQLAAFIVCSQFSFFGKL